MSFRVRNTTEQNEHKIIEHSEEENSSETNNLSEFTEIKKEVDKQFTEIQPIQKSLLYNYRTGKWLIIKKK